MRLVLDTNTVLALWHYQDPALTPLRLAIQSDDWLCFARQDSLAEFERVLGYPQFKLTPQAQNDLYQAYSGCIQLCPSPSPIDPLPYPLPQCKDRDDQKFLEISRDAQAHCLLTRDKLLLKLSRHKNIRERFKILRPEQFVEQGLIY